MTQLLRFIAISGFALFGALFAYTFVVPDGVERAGQAFLHYQVEKEVRGKLGDLEAAGYREALDRLAGKYKSDAAKAKAALDGSLAVRVANVIAAMCRLDCAKRKALKESIEAGYRTNIGAAKAALGKIEDLIRGKYLEIVQGLTRDVRIFLGSTAVLFAAVAGLAFAKPAASMQLTIPAVLLLVATVASAAFYVFGQNWFFTLLYNDYVGFAYLGWVALLLGLITDIAFNKAQITTGIFNALMSAVGAAISAIPC